MTFEDNTVVEADDLILCTGYSIDLPFLTTEISKKVMDEETNDLKVLAWSTVLTQLEINFVFLSKILAEFFFIKQ